MDNRITMSLTNLLEINDDELINLMHEKFQILVKQVALHSIINEIMDQFEKVLYDIEEIEWQLELLRIENVILLESIENLAE